jgi:hypothetical protein
VLTVKNQYFGDVNDYLKYGLLRTLCSSGALRLLVAWMLTPDDGGSDGRFRFYLERPDEWAHLDPELYAGLARLLRSRKRPRVSLIERCGLLPRAAYHSELVPDSRGERDAWFGSLLEAAKGTDLVFLDPDNGIEVPSQPMGRKGSSKYLRWSEVEQLWPAGPSLLIYQHFPRERRDRFVSRMATELRRRTAAPFIETFSTARVLFLLAGQCRHQQVLRAGTLEVVDRWGDKIEPGVPGR